MVIKLPRPISTNNLHATRKGRGRVKSKAYNTWLHHANALMWEQDLPRFDGPVTIHLSVGEVGVRPSMDGDNVLKAYLDTLVRFSVIEDDNRQILRSISMRWVPDMDGATAEVASVSVDSGPLFAECVNG